MLKEIEVLNDAASIIRKASIEACSGSSVIWAKINRVGDYIEAQIKEQLVALESA